MRRDPKLNPDSSPRNVGQQRVRSRVFGSADIDPCRSTSPRLVRVGVMWGMGDGMVVTSHGTWCPAEKKVRESLARSQLTILAACLSVCENLGLARQRELCTKGGSEQRYCVCWGEVVRG